MDLIDMAEWPIPTWSASKLEESRRLATKASGDGLSATLARARVMAASGDLDGARQQLAAFRHALDKRSLGRGELRQVIPVALLIRDHLSTLYFLTSVFATTGSVTFASNRGSSDSAVLMCVKGRDATYFISEGLLRHEHAEIRLQRLIDVYPILAGYVESPLCVEGTVVVNLGDAGRTPGLAFCSNRPGDFLIPDSIFLDARGYETIRQHFVQNCVPWEKRSPTAFWRGTTTGRPTELNLGWRSLPRVRLCEIGISHPDLIDAGLTRIVQINDPTAEASACEVGLMRQHMPPESFRQYRYQIDIDGNTSSWPGLFIKLLTGSVVLKIQSREGFEQWYYDRLKPWVNFIPVAADMSDLIEKIGWLRANDVAARSIGEAGYRLAEALTYEREIGRAITTVAAAAKKNASGEPVVDIDFSHGGVSPAYLHEGC
jgi:hypothetical protein